MTKIFFDKIVWSKKIILLHAKTKKSLLEVSGLFCCDKTIFNSIVFHIY